MLGYKHFSGVQNIYYTPYENYSTELKITQPSYSILAIPATIHSTILSTPSLKKGEKKVAVNTFLIAPAGCSYDLTTVF